jgi:hypothetical protein
MKLIPVGQSGTLFTCVDDSDFDWLNQFTWTPRQNRNTVYAGRVVKQPNGTRSIIYMHRDIIGGTTPHIDHKDANGLNNQRYNLRPATVSQNLSNQQKRTNCSSCHKGVSFVSRPQIKNCWHSYISVNKRRKHIGYYPTESEAAQAYNTAAKIHYGEFARLNQV